MELLKSVLGLLLKIISILVIVTTIGAVVLAFFLKKDVEEIKDFTEKLKREIEAETK
ncbi:hypothetical protein ACFOLA_03880 [Salinicoccus hispanicus]|uniref:hypothetical protein n=1 Tax=Salinicoccus hispanicus TaxID=157225 RepID=UPI0014786357|nr:hypothetical protein [Salinicoccus hispanicus]